MKNFFSILLLIATISCAKTEIKIPTAPEKGIHEIYNHSEVWMFFKTVNNDTIAEVNRKNTISTTHWIFNIDKRLPLKTIITPIEELKYKHANSIHSKEGMHNYFSYADTVLGKLSFLEFDLVNYKKDSFLSKHTVAKDSSIYAKFTNIHILTTPNNIYINSKKVTTKTFKIELLKLLKTTPLQKPAKLHLNFNKNVLYQKYLFIKTTVYNLNSENTSVNNTEFIFDKMKVQECVCD